MTDEVHPILKETLSDRAQVTLRMVTSAVDVAQPGLGSIFGELIAVILPANREERLAVFATKLDRRIKELNGQLEALIHRLDAEQLGLMEDGLRASVRATQEARIERIADVVAEGLQKADAASRQREVLDLLSSLSDLDITYLARFANWRGYDACKKPAATIGAWNALSPEEQEARRDTSRLEKMSQQKLISAGLLSLKYELKPRRLGNEEIELKETAPRLTTLGQFFCMQVGLWPAGERDLFPTR